MTPYSLVCSYWRCRGTYCLPTFSHNHPEDGSSVSPKRWDPPTWLYIVLMKINKRISMYIKASDIITCNSVSWTAFQKHFVMKWCMLYKCSCIREMCKAAGQRNRYSDYATDWRFEESSFDSQQGQEIFLFSKASGLSLGLTQLPIQLLPRERGPR